MEDRKAGLELIKQWCFTFVLVKKKYIILSSRKNTCVRFKYSDRSFNLFARGLGAVIPVSTSRLNFNFGIPEKEKNYQIDQNKIKIQNFPFGKIYSYRFPLRYL